jgi:hypothetical protein
MHCATLQVSQNCIPFKRTERSSIQAVYCSPALRLQDMTARHVKSCVISALLPDSDQTQPRRTHTILSQSGLKVRCLWFPHQFAIFKHDTLESTNIKEPGTNRRHTSCNPKPTTHKDKVRLTGSCGNVQVNPRVVHGPVDVVDQR